MRQFPLVPLLVLALCAAAAPAFATGVEPADASRTPRTTERPDAVRDSTIISSEAFLSGHPDMRWRLAGLEAEKLGRAGDAITYYRRAARFADKPSQGLLAEAYWLGRGVEQDRALAYAWMDLAAERGYPFLLAKREAYWNALSEAERERALELGTALYAEYGDEVAKPRMEQVMRRERRNVTGSRTGHVGALTIMIPTPGGTRTVDASHYYADKFWNPNLYWRWQDYDWKKPGMGVVEVGTVMTDENDPRLEAEDPAVVD
ncbi:tetratricopeptide repeat protein [Arenimonas composti]|uniref:Sel1 repeat family protein n=1 Tax=Arenimonas composti TR7-09 = DSM 18010 TaxID=1121013 RepID=A0A091BFU1_9GAMM|nr:sel1 repeat family protein [Arenimonas composti]KFN50606.1 hypothetical protein P873_05455 [Arenimonas composti TR7-09 = DSM 18010]